MKIKFLIPVLAIILASCSLEKPNVEKAKAAAEACLKAIDKGDVATVRNEYYTSEFVQAETEEQLKDKFQKLKEVTGPLVSMEATQASLQEETGTESCVLLTYSVKHERVTTREEFVVIIEGGKHKIGSHTITNE